MTSYLLGPRFRAAALALFLMATGVVAADAQTSGGAAGTPATPSTTPAEATPRATPPRATGLPAGADPWVRAGQPVNIRIELVLTETIDSKTTNEEKLNVVLADRQNGRLRRQGRSSNLAIDVTPELVGSRVRLTTSLTYPAASTPSDAETSRPQVPGEFLTFTQRAETFLESGKSTTVIESSKGDPASNRRVSVQVTAIILR